MKVDAIPDDVMDSPQVVEQVGLVGGAVVALVAPHELTLGHVLVHGTSLGGGEPTVVALLMVVGP